MLSQFSFYFYPVLSTSKRNPFIFPPKSLLLFLFNSVCYDENPQCRLTCLYNFERPVIVSHKNMLWKINSIFQASACCISVDCLEVILYPLESASTSIVNMRNSQVE